LTPFVTTLVTTCHRENLLLMCAHTNLVAEWNFIGFAYAQKKFINYPHHPVNASADSNRDSDV
jgi:hypothetical protein